MSSSFPVRFIYNIWLGLLHHHGSLSPTDCGAVCEVEIHMGQSESHWMMLIGGQFCQVLLWWYLHPDELLVAPGVDLERTDQLICVHGSQKAALGRCWSGKTSLTSWDVSVMCWFLVFGSVLAPVFGCEKVYKSDLLGWSFIHQSHKALRCLYSPGDEMKLNELTWHLWTLEVWKLIENVENTSHIQAFPAQFSSHNFAPLRVPQILRACKENCCAYVVTIFRVDSTKKHGLVKIDRWNSKTTSRAKACTHITIHDRW